MQTIPFSPLNQTWLKAAVVGSLWAANEIILGSFLHNLKVPFSGTVLAFMGVFLLVAFAQLWTDRGLIWKAGLICALMKSISPSAVIFGPMTGIFMEALLLQLIVSLLGNRLMAWMIGGALAVFSALLHKAASLLIIYGFDLIGIAKVLYHYILKQSGWKGIPATEVILLISGLYLLAGMLAALIGYQSGKRTAARVNVKISDEVVNLRTSNPLFDETSKQPYSLALLFLNILFIVITLLLINLNLYLLAGITGLFYLSFCFIRYRHSLRKLRKPAFWIYFFVITLVATFLWKGLPDGNFFQSEGLITGLKMNARALIIMVGFAAIGAELKNPFIKSVLYSRGFASLYQSLSLAFSALPYIIERQPGMRKLFSRSSGAMDQLFLQAMHLLDLFGREHASRPDVIIVAGDIRQGKTSWVADLNTYLTEKGIRTAGFIAKGIHEHGQRVGFHLLDLQTGRETDLCTTQPDESRIRFGRYYFDPDAFNTGNDILHPDRLTEADLVIVDEIGPLELNNQGWNRSVEQLCSARKPLQLWVVRKNLVEQVAKKWNTGTIYVFDISVDTVGDCGRWVCKMLSR